MTGIRTTPDATLGNYTSDSCIHAVAVELKSPGADLDEPQPSYVYRTPVEQGFGYGKSILGIRWVLVSDMRILRLYSIESEGEYEEIDLRECIDNGSATPEFRRLIFLFHYDYLVKNFPESQVSKLYAKSFDRQIQIRDGFYDAYYWIRKRIFEELKKASQHLDPVPDREELLEATQRLLDRLLFICYCEDHPQQLIRDRTLESITTAARNLPGGTGNRVYEFLKNLFREIDAGSPPASGLNLAAYNGELFKFHRIIDAVDLPDSLQDERFAISGPSGDRLVHGVWGLHIYDFWSELNEYLLGHIFEESLSDLRDLVDAPRELIAKKLEERKAGGIFYTSGILAEFLCASSLAAVLDESAPLVGTCTEELIDAIERRIARLLSLRAIDFACGSGAFLTSLYRELLHEFWRLQSSLAALRNKTSTHDANLISAAEVIQEARLLPKCIYGVDILPQAVEIAKLAIWLRSARKGEKVLDLSSNIVAGDSLAVSEIYRQLSASDASFDLVVGNPPWGGDIAQDSYDSALAYLDLSSDVDWDSWELFVLLAIRALREGGRLALVLPDSFFYPQKARLRRIVFNSIQVEKAHSLGPDWFGAGVRMGTMILQGRRGQIDPAANFESVLLAGPLRQQAIRGEIPLSQIESQRGRDIPLGRVLESESREIEVFRGISWTAPL